MAVLRAAVKSPGDRLCAVLAGDVGHLAVSLAVFEDAVKLHIGEVVGDHRFGILGVAQEDVVEARFLDVVFGINVVLLLDARVCLIPCVYQ